MPTIRVEFQVEVKAGAERLWDILTDVKSWPEWQVTSYIKPIPAGPLKEGSTFKVKLGGLTWNLTVTEAERPKKVSWLARRTGLNALHEWEFVEKGGTTKAVTRESMSGWMLFLSYPIAKRNLQKADEKWLSDLKSRAEKI